MPHEMKIGFLGAGKMATALARGFISAGNVSPQQVLGADVSEAACEAFAQATSAKTTRSNVSAAEACSVLVLAVKPDQASAVLAEIRPKLGTEKLLVSIAAGVPLSRLESMLEPGARVIRVMPNTPALVGCSAAAFALGSSASPADGELVLKLLSSVGVAFALKETLLDAVTGLSGSGPAYVYLMIEALSDGGVAVGLPRDVATKLAAQTVLGGAKMVLDTGLHPGALKDMVASPGGTTIEGLHELEKGGFRGTVMNAVRAATEKAKRLGQG